MTATRIYRVELAGKASLVRAPNAARAVAHVARSQTQCRVASQDDLVQMLADGATVVTAGAEEPQEVLEVGP